MLNLANIVCLFYVPLLPHLGVVIFILTIYLRCTMVISMGQSYWPTVWDIFVLLNSSLYHINSVCCNYHSFKTISQHCLYIAMKNLPYTILQA